MVGLERMSDYRGVRVQRFHCSYMCLLFAFLLDFVIYLAGCIILRDIVFTNFENGCACIHENSIAKI